jgi:cobalamin biosynthesis Mg chelatase CobN
MVNKLLSAICAMALLASCSRQTASFQRSSSEPIARQTAAVSAPVAAPEPVVPAPVATEATVTEPVLIASTTETKAAAVPTRAETRQAARTARVQQVLNAAKAQPNLAGETRQLTGTEKLVTKLVAKKINKQIAKGQKAQAVGGNVVIGIVLLAVALILGLIGQGLLAAIVAVIGVLFLILGLLNSASLTGMS